MHLDKYSDSDLIQDFILKNYLMIDLRKREDALKNPLPYFVNIPYTELKNYLYQFKKEIPIVVCCYYGHISEYAYTDLKNLGFDVTIVKGGYYALTHPIDLKFF